MLLDPRLPELHALLDVRMPSPVLLGLLRQAGVNLLPTDRDAAPLHAVTPKDAELEEEALRELLRLAPTFRLAHSKWNASRARDKVCVRVGVNLAKVLRAAPRALRAAARPRALSGRRARRAPRACCRCAGG